MGAVASHLYVGVVRKCLTKPLVSETTHAILPPCMATPPLVYNISPPIPASRVDNVAVVAKFVNALDNTSAVGYIWV